MVQTASEASATQPTVLDRVVTTRPTPRVERLRKAFLDIKHTVSIERLRIETRVMRETADEPMVTRRAKVVAAVMREMSIDIYPDELFAGYTSLRPLSLNLTGLNILNLSGLRSASDSQDSLVASGLHGLSDEEKRELEEELVPYWHEQPRVRGYGAHYGHNSHDYAKVVKKGFLGIKQEAEDRLARLDPTDPADAAKVPFLEGLAMAMGAAAEVGKRFAARARKLAAAEEDGRRKTELFKIAEVCDWVPANPARTFREALQSYYFAWLAMTWELGNDFAFAQGRVDQHLYPYYESDIEGRRITREEAQELLDCYILKLNKVGSLSGGMGIGGLKADGNDATNELSYMFIEAIMHTRLTGPWFAVLIHSKTPDALLMKACALNVLGTGHPQFLNCDVMVAQALARGNTGGPAVTLADARSATNVGCIEPAIPGKDSGYLYYSMPNLAAVMEQVLTNGKGRPEREGMGPERIDTLFWKWIGPVEGLKTGDPRQFKSFEEVLEAYRRQLAWARGNSQTAGSMMEQDIVDLFPTVCESALIEGCIERGICREAGGAHYNFNTGSNGVGSTDVADSLTAIRMVVFDDKKITMAELCDALDNNFAGRDDIRRMCLEAPKFGNSDDYADEQAVWVLHQWVSEFRKIENLRGGSGCVGGSPMGSYVPLGKLVGALPSGRLGGEPLCDGHSPGRGHDLNGPTAVLRSMGKVDSIEIAGGIILNMRLDPAIAYDKDGVKRMADVMRAFIDEKIFHVQFNLVSSDTLRDAQKAPEKHRDLVVRVAGYNAFFTRLPRALQDTIITRTVHGL